MHLFLVLSNHFNLYFQTNQLTKVQPVIDKMEAVNNESGFVYLVKTFLCNAQGNDECFYQNLVKSLKCSDVTLEQKLFLVSQFSKSFEGFAVTKVDSVFEILSAAYPDSAIVYNVYSEFL